MVSLLPISYVRVVLLPFTMEEASLKKEVELIVLTRFRVRARICAQVKTSLLVSSQSRAISRISRSGAPFWKGECLGYNAKANLCREA